MDRALRSYLSVAGTVWLQVSYEIHLACQALGYTAEMKGMHLKNY